MAPKSHCGLDLPLDANFDFAIWRKQPIDLLIPDDMDLQERNQHNFDAQMVNRISVRATRAYETAVKNGTIPATTTDIGTKLIAYYAYNAEELEKMVSSVDYCTQVVAPIPPKLMEYILEERGKRAKAFEKKKEEEKEAKEKGSELQGSMVMSNITKINALTRPPVSTPPSLMATIKYKMHPSLFWFTDIRLRYATEHSADMPMRKNTTIPNAPEKSLLDVAKLKTIWGTDDSTDGVSILNWINASENFLEALKLLSTAPDNTNPLTYATEMAKHFAYIQALDDFEALFQVWYPVEKKLRNKITDNNLAFDAAYWTSEFGGVLNAWKAAKAIATGLFAAPATKITDLGTLSGLPSSFNTQLPSAPRQHHQNHRDDARDPATGLRNVDNGWYDRDSFHDRGRDSFREQGANPPRKRRPVVCLICADNHPLKEHSPTRTEFKDRTVFFSTYEGGALKTARERRIICIGWNCNVGGRTCDGSDHPADRERLHICSLCGGNHPALPGNSRCARFRDGAFTL
ncbi:hypothetical protein C8R44DRAFT_927132 [Mycena epipterygia]|nr:hypothetical protein C8R44DRAFT_927132 [Mycena epipterygia]